MTVPNSTLESASLSLQSWPTRRAAARWAGALGSLLVVGSAPPAQAEDVTGPCAALLPPNNAPSTDPRVDHLVVDGVHVTVLVPPSYRLERRRYPVLYLFHGAFGDEDAFSTQTDLLPFTSRLHPDQQAIVVMPDGGHLPTGRDWVDGTHHQETFVIHTLVPYVDAHYRSFADRSQRALAGFSAGGMNAVLFAARHPDMFIAAGSLSGFLDPFDPTGMQVVLQFADLDNQLCGANNNRLGLWGDPVAHPMGWIGFDPIYLAPALEDISLYIASGNGVPCPGDPNDPSLVFAEGVVYQMSQNFDAVLTAAGIRHVSDFRTCGLHQYSSAGQYLHRFWPQMVDAFGGRPPAAFDYRSADSVASVWNWTFRTDAGRAPEFLDVRNASKDGVTLEGSGALSVTTAPLFHPGARVSIDGTGPVVADDGGRLTFAVDLGPPHTLEQGTPEQRAAESATARYFTTRSVRFQQEGDEGAGSCGHEK